MIGYLFHSIAGFGGLLSAVLIAIVSFFMYRSPNISRKAQWRTCLVLSAGYALMSAGFYRRSFETSHETLETSLIIWAGIVVIFADIIYSRRYWKKETAQ